MTENTSRQRRGPSDATDYSSSTAPDTQQAAEEHQHPSETRLQPGGTRATAADPGMSSLDRETTVSGGRSTGQQDIGSTEDETGS